MGAKEIPGEARTVQQHGRKRSGLDLCETEKQVVLNSDIAKCSKWARETWWWEVTHEAPGLNTGSSPGLLCPHLLSSLLLKLCPTGQPNLYKYIKKLCCLR